MGLKWHTQEGKVLVIADCDWDSPAGQTFLGATNLTGKAALATIDGPVDEKELQHPFVCVAGNAALHLYRPDLGVGQCHGRPMAFHNDDTVVVPVFHPEAYHRNPRWRISLVNDFNVLRGIAAGKEPWVRHSTCVFCRRPATVADKNLLLVCSRHGRTIRVNM